MGVSIAVPGRGVTPRSSSFIIGGLAAWLCGVFAIGLALVMIALLARAGWAEMGAEAVSGSEIVPSLEWSVALITIALPLAAMISIGAGIAAAERSIGGLAGRLINVALRAGPAIPSIAIGVAALAIVTTDPRIADATRQHPIVSAAVALAALNLPIMSARFRTVFRAVPIVWRIAAVAAGATPGLAFWRIVLPRARPGIVAVLLRGAGQMLGETAVIAIVLSLSNVAHAPLSVYVWQRLTQHGAPTGATGPSAAAEVLALVVAIAALRVASRGLLRRARRSGTPA